MLQVPLLTVEGLIGAGKSSQIQLLRERLAEEEGIVFLEEPVDKWMAADLLQGFYRGELSAATFQLSVLMSLAGPLFSAACSKPKLIVSERSPFSNFAVFAKANLAGAELNAYAYTFKELLAAMPPMKVTSVYLETTVETALDRTRARERDSESEIKEEYMQLLHDLHDRMEHALPDGSEFVRVDANGEAGETADRLYEIVSEILKN